MQTQPLSYRERQALLLLACGLTLQQVADKMNIKPNTVKTYRQKIYNKLGTQCLVKAVGVALCQRYITFSDWRFLLATCP